MPMMSFTILKQILRQYRIVEVGRQWFATIQSENCVPVFACQREVVESKIAYHTLLVRSLGDDDNAFVRQELQGNLRIVFPILCADGTQCFVGKNPLVP